MAEGVGLEGRWMGMNKKRDEEGGRKRDRWLNVVIAGATKEVAYVSGFLDARGGVCVCGVPQAFFLDHRPVSCFFYLL